MGAMERQLYTPKEVWDAMVSLTVYNKLAGAQPDVARHYYVSTIDLAEKINPEGCKSSMYGRYHVIFDMKTALDYWEDMGVLTTYLMNGSYAIHHVMLDALQTNKREWADDYINEIIGNNPWPPKQ